MSLTRNDVEKVSLLARLSLTPAELDLLTTQLTAVVGYVEQLKELDTDDVEPMAHALPTANVFRDDVPRSSDDADSGERALAERAALLANAPHSDGEFYLVPAVLGE
ncbi:MAG: Asp-tRNA(Asn)/Glu-tRNA(Gln) amidotransferase subunit GatC [Planctomycetia bacterium]|nr:Asp-tRNA(Asn)/Glu-tRNA(Gln) amidotransferase subunit GatC [Planctomycetia bacterium]